MIALQITAIVLGLATTFLLYRLVKGDRENWFLFVLFVSIGPALLWGIPYDPLFVFGATIGFCFSVAGVLLWSLYLLRLAQTALRRRR